MYTYLAGHVGRSGYEGAFRALTHGYTHWASMKTGVHHVYLLLQSDDTGLAFILSATCECAAGYVMYKMLVLLTAYIGIYLI